LLPLSRKPLNPLITDNIIFLVKSVKDNSSGKLN